MSLKSVVPNGDKATMGIGETKVLKIIDNAPELTCRTNIRDYSEMTVVEFY